MEIGALPRDAARSRAAILDAAERLFAERGPSGATLQEIGAVAGLSRATPSYFFGSKTALHRAVLERVVAARDDAVRDAFAGIHAWAAGEDPRELDDVLLAAVDGYLRFLVERPSFGRLLAWEALGGGAGVADLRARATDSSAMTEAFTALRGAAPRDGLAAFSVRDAILVLVSLTFSPAGQQTTLLRSLGLDLRRPDDRAQLAALAVSQLRATLGRAASGDQ